MASTKKYLSHLLQNTGITPACSEEERAAADVIAKVFANHGFEPEVQEFNASGSYKLVQASLGIAAFVGAVLMGIGGAFGIVGLLLAVAAAALYWVERSGRPVLSGLGRGGLSQNVIAYHKASGPLASPRNRPVVVVAHYDSPRVDLLAQQPYATYRPLMVKALPLCMVAPAVFAVLRMLPFPDAAKGVLWLLAVVAALVPLANAVAVIANRFVLPFTTGSVCNKSSVAAMLGVMDAVAPFSDAEEFPEDVPADEYFAEQERIVEEAARAAAEQEAAAAAAMYPHEQEAAGDADGLAGDAAEGGVEVGAELDPDAAVAGLTEADGEAAGLFEVVPAEIASEGESHIDDVAAAGTAAPMDPSSTVAMQVHAGEPASTQVVAVVDVDARTDSGEAAEVADDLTDDDGNDAPYALSSAGAIRFGADVVRGLNMLPTSCVVVYEDDVFERATEVVSVEEPGAGAELPIEEVAAFDAPVEEMLPTEAEGDLACAPAVPNDQQQELLPPDEMAEQLEPEMAPMNDPRETVVADADEGVEEVSVAALGAQQIAGDELPVEEVAVEVESLPAGSIDQGATQIFEVTPVAAEPEHTVAMPVQPVETVDSLMAEISRPAPAPVKAPALDIPNPLAAAPAAIPATANRASLFDLPDPLAANDPFGVPTSTPAPQPMSAPEFSVVEPVDVPAMPAQPIETISAPAPVEEKPRRGLGRLFGRKKKRDDSMSDWLGVDDGFDAKSSGYDIGSWDNFDDDGWKGGATGLSTMTEDDLRDAITSMGDDELLGHDIWFVATGASECGNAGIKAFLDEHRDKLRGVFLINLESVGAGTLATLATEGRNRVLKGDRRIGGLVSRVSADFHQEFERVEMPYEATDAYAAMEMSLRSLTIAGVDEAGFALSHTGDDQPYNVDPENVARVADVVTEVIRRS